MQVVGQFGRVVQIPQPVGGPTPFGTPLPDRLLTQAQKIPKPRGYDSRADRNRGR